MSDEDTFFISPHRACWNLINLMFETDSEFDTYRLKGQPNAVGFSGPLIEAFIERALNVRH